MQTGMVRAVKTMRLHGPVVSDLYFRRLFSCRHAPAVGLFCDLEGIDYDVAILRGGVLGPLDHDLERVLSFRQTGHLEQFLL